MKDKPSYQTIHAMVCNAINANGGPDRYVEGALLKVTKAVNGSLACAPDFLTMQDVKARIRMTLSKFERQTGSA